MESSSSSWSSPLDQERYSYNPTLRWNPKVEEYFVSAYGADHFARISKTLTHPSSYSCIRVNSLKSTTDEVIDKLATVLREKGLPRNIPGDDSEENLHDGKIDYREESQVDSLSRMWKSRLSVADEVGMGAISKCQIPVLDNVVFVKGSGPHPLKYCGEGGRSPKEIIVSRKCAEAVLRGAQVYVPGVLACSCHVEKGDKSAVSVALEQLVSEDEYSVGITRGRVLHGSEIDPQYSERNGLYIGLGTAMLSRAAIFRASQGIAVEMTERVYELPSFNNVLEGEIFLQNLPSIVASHALDPQEGERILDMCAAPGGKTTAIALLMKDRGEIIATDRSHNKVMDIMKLASEMGLNSIHAFRLDALKSVSTNKMLDANVDFVSKESIKNVEPSDVKSVVEALDFPVEESSNMKNACRGQLQPTGCRGSDAAKAHTRMNSQQRNGPGRSNCMGCRVENSKGFSPHSFDRVLLDAPCSALGLRPRLFAGEETMKSLRNHGIYQRRMFDQAVRLVRPGGVIVYSTCTINPGENEAVIRYALDTYKFLSLASQYPHIGGPGLVGHYEISGETHEKWLSPSEAELVQRFDPSSSLDTIGFFIAKLNVGQNDL